MSLSKKYFLELHVPFAPIFSCGRQLARQCYVALQTIAADRCLTTKKSPLIEARTEFKKIFFRQTFLFHLGFTLGLFCVQDVNAGEQFVIQNGSTVTIHYTLNVDNKVVDSAIGRNSLTYVQGSGQIIPGLEEQLKDLKQGDKKHITLLPNKGYGPIDSEAFQNVPRKSFRNLKSLKIGGVVTGRYQGKPVQATILAIDKKNVVLDLNHPLAGKTLEFDVEVLEIKH